MKLTWSSRALSDMRALADWLMPRSQRGAAAVIRRIEKTGRMIANHPSLGRALRLRGSVRVIPIGKYPYVVYFTIRTEDVLILHIRHTSRRSPRARDLR